MVTDYENRSRSFFELSLLLSKGGVLDETTQVGDVGDHLEHMYKSGRPTDDKSSAS
jgi:hypothetical protein